MRFLPPAAFAALAAVISMAHASTEFGSKEEAQQIAATLSAIVQTEGLEEAISALHDPERPFSASRLGIHIFEKSVIVADNREPELIASSYAEIEDLTGEPMWPRITAAADARSDAVLEWYHYDTEAEYTYHCHSEWAVSGDVLVMVCR